MGKGLGFFPTRELSNNAEAGTFGGFLSVTLLDFERYTVKSSSRLVAFQKNVGLDMPCNCNYN